MENYSDILVKVRRQPGDWRVATYRLSDISGIDWDDVSGGIRTSFMGQYFMYGYVWCNEAVDGAVAHSGEHGLKNHGPCPHRIKVCILKMDNEKAVYEYLKEDLPPKPQQERAKPKSGKLCKYDIMTMLIEKGAMRETRLTAILMKIGHGENNIKAVLKKLANVGILYCTKDAADRRYNVYGVNAEQNKDVIAKLLPALKDVINRIVEL